MPDTVVVGVDSSPSGRAALSWAADWATLSGARLRAVHVITPRDASAPSWYLDTPDWADWADSADSDTRERGEVTRVFDALTPQERWTLESVRGPAGPVLVEAAAGASLLVVGTRHRTGLSRLLEGSVSEYCLRHAACPVTTVPAAGDARGLAPTPAESTTR